MGPANVHRSSGQGSGDRQAEGRPTPLDAQRLAEEHERIERERRALEERLEEARRQESIGRLSSVMARDVNALLSAVIEQLSLIGAPWDAEASEAVAGATAAALRAEKMVREMGALDPSQGPRARELDPREIVLGLRDLLGRRVDPRVQLLIDADEPVGTIVADPEQIEQVILNLVDNANDSMPGGGTVELRLHSAEVDTVVGEGHDHEARVPYVVFEVIDTGTGIDDVTAADLLAQGVAVADEASLNLALVRGIVRQHGGFIDVRSKHGEGSTFAVYLPRFAEPGAVGRRCPGGCYTNLNNPGSGREAPPVSAG